MDILSGSFDLAVPGGLVVGMALAAAVAAIGAWGVVDARREPSRGRRRTLVVLRALTAGWILALGLQPRWRADRVRETEGVLAVLFDTSRSMGIGAADDATRAEEATALAERWGAEADPGRVTLLGFDGSAHGTTWDGLAGDYPARGDATRIAASILEVVEEHAGGEEVGALLVVSDGSDRTLEERVGSVAERGVRVHAVALGAGAELVDQAIAEIEADPVAFLREPARVRVVVRSTGAASEALPVTLRKDGQVVREVLVDVPRDGTAEVTLPFTPSRLGRAVYEVSIPVSPDDAVPVNNERAFLVRVNRDRLRVLLIAGAPSWDVRFLRAFLKRDPSIDLVSFFILRSSSDLTMAPASEMALIPFPTDELFREHLGSFDVVLFQNFDYGPYEMGPYLPRIRDYVLRGGSFAMIGGERSLGSGGYASTPVAEVLPVRLPSSGTGEDAALVTGRFRPSLVEANRAHPIVALLPDPLDNVEAWAGLAPLEGANLLLGLQGDGRSLLVHPERRRGGVAMPVLAVGTAGRGRVLALGVDTSWRWGMTTAGASGDASAYERFWDRTLRWLARDPSLDASRLDTDRERYGPEAPMEVELLLRDAGYAPDRERSVTLREVDDAGNAVAESVVRTDERGRVETVMPAPVAAGGYRLEARVEGEAEPRCELGFVVEAGGDELADVRPRPDLLRALVEATGGSFVEDAADAPPLDSFDVTRRRVTGTVESAPLASAWAFAVALLLFGLEWGVRRRWGLR